MWKAVLPAMTPIVSSEARERSFAVLLPSPE